MFLNIFMIKQEEIILFAIFKICKCYNLLFDWQNTINHADSKTILYESINLNQYKIDNYWQHNFS